MKEATKHRCRLRYLPWVAFTAAGILGGYLYYRLIGCASGSCAIASSPYLSTIYGGIIGSLLGFAVTPSKKCSCRQEEEFRDE